MKSSLNVPRTIYHGVWRGSRVLLLGAVTLLGAGSALAESCAGLAIGAPGDRQSGVQSGAVNYLPGERSADGLTLIGDDILAMGDLSTPGDPEDGDFLGFGLAAGDFNGDSWADLAMGAPGKTFAGAVDAGAVVISYGNGSLRAGGQYLTQDFFACCEPAEEEFFGHALAVGDFDVDGYDDLAIGSWGEHAGRFAAPDSGQVQVSYGSMWGLSVARSELWQQGLDGVFENPDSEDRFGFSLVVGDFDGDGRDDLAIGVPGENQPTPPFPRWAGAVQVLYSDGDGLSTAGQDLWLQDTLLGAGAGKESDFFGWTLAAGDFNRDGRDDLAIGSPFDEGVTGTVHVLYGTATGLSQDGHQLWTQGTLGDDMETGDQFGRGLAAGDFNLDGYDDLAIGAPGETIEDPPGEIEQAGQVHVLYGSAAGLKLQGTIVLSRDDPNITGGADDFDEFGETLTAGDFNCDRADDLAIGVPGYGTSLFPDIGAVNVIYGGRFIGLLPIHEEEWRQDFPGVEGVGLGGDRFGETLAVVPVYGPIFKDGFEAMD